jgi:hypothetical protein
MIVINLSYFVYTCVNVNYGILMKLPVFISRPIISMRFHETMNSVMKSLKLLYFSNSLLKLGSLKNVLAKLIVATIRCLNILRAPR